jgi:hypothetical protein
MLLQPTAKARLDLHPGVQTLTMRERSLLLLADASKSSADLRRLFNGMGAQIVLDLVRQGYLAPVGDTGRGPAGAAEALDATSL